MNEKKWMIPDPVRKGERSATRPDADPSRQRNVPRRYPLFWDCVALARDVEKQMVVLKFFFQLSIAPVLQKT